MRRKRSARAFTQVRTTLTCPIAVMRETWLMSWTVSEPILNRAIIQGKIFLFYFLLFSLFSTSFSIFFFFF